MDIITAARFSAINAQSRAMPQGGFSPDTASFAGSLLSVSASDGPPKDVMELLKMIEELEEKDEKKKKKDANASADAIMEALRAQQEQMRGVRDTRIVKDKRHEAEAVSGQENADFRDAAAKSYLSALKDSIKKKYGIA